MSKILPPTPKLIFCYLEPVSLVAGAIAPLVDPAYLISTQLGHLKPHPVLPTEHVLALQLANLYFGLFLLGVLILNTTSEPRVVHVYLIALLIADVGHIAATGWVTGMQEFLKFQTWFGSATAMGNLPFVVFLMSARTLYLLGFLGKDQTARKRTKRS